MEVHSIPSFDLLPRVVEEGHLLSRLYLSDTGAARKTEPQWRRAYQRPEKENGRVAGGVPGQRRPCECLLTRAGGNPKQAPFWSDGAADRGAAATAG
jgi:hypothetical protein